MVRCLLTVTRVAQVHVGGTGVLGDGVSARMWLDQPGCATLRSRLSRGHVEQGVSKQSRQVDDVGFRLIRVDEGTQGLSRGETHTGVLDGLPLWRGG